MIKAVVLDGDGVVLLGPSFSQRYMRKYKIPFDLMKPFFDKEFQLCAIGKLDLKQALKNYLESWRWKGSTEELIHFWLSQDVLNYQLLEEVKQWQRQGVLCSLGSNQEKYRARYMIEDLGLKKNFKRLYFSCFLKAKKPDLAFYEKIRSSLKRDIKGIRREEIVFIDDEKEIVLKATSFGFRMKLYTNFQELKQWLTRHIQTESYDKIG